MREASGNPTGPGYDRLLARLASDPARAAVEFERLRASLLQVCDWRGAPWPDDAADETLTRLATRLGAGEDVRDVAAFAHGIARHVLREQFRVAARSTTLDRAGSAGTAASGDRAAVPDLAHALDACLERLSDDERSLVIAYYASRDGQVKIDWRHGMADKLGISPGALRSRVQRLRDHLERCVRKFGESPRHGSASSRTQDEGTR